MTQNFNYINKKSKFFNFLYTFFNPVEKFFTIYLNEILGFWFFKQTNFPKIDNF